MPTKRHKIETYLNDEEKAHLDGLTTQLRLSRSELLRRLVLAQRLPDPSHFAAHQGIRDLLKVNADLARLGNLFKLALDETPEADLKDRLLTLAREIAEVQAELKAGAREIRAVIRS